MKSLGQTFGAAGAISGATIGSIASMLYLMFAYMLGRKERRAEIDASQRFKDERVSYILKAFNCCHSYNNRSISNATCKYDR